MGYLNREDEKRLARNNRRNEIREERQRVEKACQETVWIDTARRRMEPQPREWWDPTTITRMGIAKPSGNWEIRTTDLRSVLYLTEPADMPGAKMVFDTGVWYWETPTDANS